MSRRLGPARSLFSTSRSTCRSRVRLTTRRFSGAFSSRSSRSSRTSSSSMWRTLLSDVVRHLTDPNLPAHIPNRLASAPYSRVNRIRWSVNLNIFIASSPCRTRTPEAPYCSSKYVRKSRMTSGVQRRRHRIRRVLLHSSIHSAANARCTEYRASMFCQRRASVGHYALVQSLLATVQKALDVHTRTKLVRCMPRCVRERWLSRCASWTMSADLSTAIA